MNKNIYDAIRLVTSTTLGQELFLADATVREESEMGEGDIQAGCHKHACIPPQGVGQ